MRVLIGRTFVPLTEPRRLPVGTEFDARHGIDDDHRGGAWAARCPATFSGAVFRLGQPAFGPSRGLPAAALADGAFPGVPAYSGCHGRTAQVLQTLHASIGGRWRVKGRFSAGTARAGAQWATSDRCDGTLTAVHRGTVQVARSPAGRRSVNVGARTQLPGSDAFDGSLALLYTLPGTPRASKPGRGARGAPARLTPWGAAAGTTGVARRPLP